MERTDSGLWIAHGFSFLRHRATERTVTLRDGRRAKVTVDDSGTVTQIESDEQLDAIVRPKTVRLLKPFGGSPCPTTTLSPKPKPTSRWSPSNANCES